MVMQFPPLFYTGIYMTTLPCYPPLYLFQMGYISHFVMAAEIIADVYGDTDAVSLSLVSVCACGG